VNGVAIQSIAEYESLSASPTVLELQKAYIRKVIDAVRDLPNVLYEVTNESLGSGSAEWQYSVIDYIKQYEGAEHPVGMSWYPGSTLADLLASPADWVSPGISPSVFNNPPAADGTKVLIGDSDHQAAFQATPLWAWKSFVRGWNPILIDGRLTDIQNPPPFFPDQEPAEYALGDTLRYAKMMKLVDTQPRGDLTSTGYALSNPGDEYLVLQPAGASQTFSVTLVPGMYSLRWFFLNNRSTKGGGVIAADGNGTTFAAPVGTSGPAVLYIKRVGG
jgi:predicted outer membrane repeat protein